eukprot:scaffold4280_cov385-Prasinococcus_capsulatus_cf.AAC.7
MRVGIASAATDQRSAAQLARHSLALSRGRRGCGGRSGAPRCAAACGCCDALGPTSKPTDSSSKCAMAVPIAPNVPYWHLWASADGETHITKYAREIFTASSPRLKLALCTS